jgi:hypothetical protein
MEFVFFPAISHPIPAFASHSEDINDTVVCVKVNLQSINRELDGNHITVVFASGWWNPSTVNLDKPVQSCESAAKPCQKEANGESHFGKLLKTYLCSNAENSALAQQIMASADFNVNDAMTSLACTAIKECLSRSQQDHLMLSSLLKRNADENCPVIRIPEFGTEDLKSFGPRAAYQAQLRLPWSNSNSRRRKEAEVISQRAAFDQAYNQARGGLPVCTVCTSIEGSSITGHTRIHHDALAMCTLTRTASFLDLRRRSSQIRQRWKTTLSKTDFNKHTSVPSEVIDREITLLFYIRTFLTLSL